ncbi:MAG TPA: primosomal protein N' [Opitutales bacterium]|nr:primosomal protein N' [Opitutales bacterium]
MPFTGLRYALSYSVPEPLQAGLLPGMLVRVPLGPRVLKGLVTKVHDLAPSETEFKRLKPIVGIEYPHPLIGRDLIELIPWLESYYAASRESVLEALIPAAVRDGVRCAVDVSWELVAPQQEGAWDALKRRAPKQWHVLEVLKAAGQAIAKAELVEKHGLTPAVAKGLVQSGFVRELRQERLRMDFFEQDALLEGATQVDSQPPVLMPEQKAAAESMRTSLDANAFKVHLLHGLTGSGKTEVYLSVMTEALRKGLGVIFLVPEVALTAQTVARLRARLNALGEGVVVWHSHLSDGERRDAYLALAQGTVKVVVGARSAIFAPVQRLGLIVVDEEHDPAYKQEETPRYHARDVAVYRAYLAKALCVLGSATPSLESVYNVEAKGYVLNQLTMRVDDRQLPRVYLVDMRHEVAARRGPVALSRVLTEKIRERLEKREQVILFLNRRGYHARLFCPECGYVASCLRCSITLTHHRTHEDLRCHLCGHRERVPQRCPQCDSDAIKGRAPGTQRIEDVVQQIFPHARLERLDADTLNRKHAFVDVLKDFRLGKIDILIGTQMLAKGLDFPNVTLVGILDADLSMHRPDFRAHERTFQLLVQVSGRAGRGDRAGEVVAQSFNPDSAPLQFARLADYEGFYRAELELRRAHHYPPFRHLVRHVFRGRNLEKVQFYCEHWARQIQSHFGDRLEVRGPSPAPIEKIKDDYRFQLWYFMGPASKLIAELAKLRSSFKMDPDVSDYIDVDAQDLS